MWIFLHFPVVPKNNCVLVMTHEYELLQLLPTLDIYGWTEEHVVSTY